MMIFKLVNERKLVRMDNEAVAAGTTKLYAIFELSDSFTGTIRSYWRREDTDQTYDVILEEDGSCLVPWEVLTKTENTPPWPYTYDHTVVVSLADTSRVTSTECEIKVETSSYSEETENTSPTPSTGGGGTAEVTAESIEKALGYMPANANEIPANTSQLNNDSGFITKLVTDLANYYTKSQTYTKEEVGALVSAVPKFSIQVVSSLPTTNISNTTVYLLKSGDEQSNLYTEYIYVNGAWEYLGKQTVDLSGYALKTDIPTKLSALTDDVGYITQTALNTALAGYAQKATTLAGYGITDGATTAQFEQLNNEKVDKNWGASNAGKILVVGTDGTLVLTDMPEASGDVTGVLDENMNILLSGNLADGTYTLQYLNTDGTYSKACTLVVGAIPEPEVVVNLLPTLTDIDLVTPYNNGTGYKENTRVSVSTISTSNPSGEKTQENACLLGLMPIGNDGDVFHFRNAIVQDLGITNYSGLIWHYDKNGVILQSGTMAVRQYHTIGKDANGDATITMKHSNLVEGTAYIRFNICNPTGELIMTRNQLIPLN